MKKETLIQLVTSELCQNMLPVKDFVKILGDIMHDYDFEELAEKLVEYHKEKKHE